jgi:hypothetical protein
LTTTIRPYGKATLGIVFEGDWTVIGDWHEVQEDGIWVKKLAETDGRRPTTKAYLAARLAHPKGNIELPALPFPFDDEGFFEFYEACGQCDLIESTYANDDDSIDSAALTRLRDTSPHAGQLVARYLMRKYDVSLDGFSAPPMLPSPRPQNRSELHERRILERLQSLGYEPQSLPPQRRGLKNVTQRAARESLVKARTMTEASFDHAWQSLRNSGAIVQQTL